MMRRWQLLAILLPGIAIAWQSTQTGQELQFRAAGVMVALPQGWHYDSSRRSITASRDGPLLDSITMSFASHREAFAAAHRKSGVDVVPEDLAESYVANLQAGPAATHAVRLLSSEPAELAGRPAFRVHLRYIANEPIEDVEMEEITVGTAMEDGLLLVTYRAPSIHYFGTYRPDFEATVRQIDLPGKPGRR